MATLAPRFRGRAIRTGKAWSWELLISIGPDGDGVDPIAMTSNKDFISRDAALVDLRKTVPGVMNEVAKVMNAGKIEGVHDLKSGTMETMDEWVERVTKRHVSGN